MKTQFCYLNLYYSDHTNPLQWVGVMVWHVEETDSMHALKSICHLWRVVSTSPLKCHVINLPEHQEVLSTSLFVSVAVNFYLFLSEFLLELCGGNNLGISSTNQSITHNELTQTPLYLWDHKRNKVRFVQKKSRRVAALHVPVVVTLRT